MSELTQSQQLTTESLRAILFQEMIELRAGKSTPKQAMAVSSLAKTIVDSAALDISVARIGYGLDMKKGDLPEIKPLTLSHNSEAA